jgi:SAM-dependent methyltransferase
MQDDTGTNRILTFPFVYSAFQTLVGATYGRRWILSDVWRVRPGMRIVDIGCGPGDIVDSLPDVQYIGLDVSADYIRDAKRRFGHRGTFVAGTAPALLDEPLAHGADLVTCTGVLHHLDDADSLEIFNVAHTLLKPGGRFIAVEPTYLRHQGSIARWIMSKDRGMAIRQESVWRQLAARSRFGGAETNVLTGVLRIPYTHLVIECTKTDATPPV